MSEPEAQELKIYEITHRETGKVIYQPATNAESACQQVGWIIGDCYVRTPSPRYHHHKKGESTILAKIPCQVCPFQYAECRKPAEAVCLCQPNSPELHEWLKQISQAHLCEYVGVELTRNDYNLGQKWLPIEDAIRELAPQI